MIEEIAPGAGSEWRPDGPLPPITRIELPTPFPVGPVNCYVVDDDPLTLVDCGPLTEDAWATLQAELARLGRRVQDIRRLIITHGHVDHFGLAARIVELSGAEVWAYRSLEHWLTDYESEWQRRTAYLTLLLNDMGVPAGEMVAINRGVKGVGRFAHAVPVTRLLDAGDVISLAGLDWMIHYTPGHATGHISLHQPETRTLLSGDHLLPDISSNPVLEAPPLGERDRPRLLPLYVESLGRVANLPVLWVFPGHGRPFQGHRKLIKGRLELHEERAARLFGFLEEGAADCRTLSRRLFPRLEGVDLFLGFSETLGHLDLLEDRGQIALHTGRRPLTYERVQ